MSKVEILNRALLKLGEPPISSLNDVEFGRSYEMVYDDVKNLLLSSYPWRFAVKHQRIARRKEMFNDKYMYSLPADCLFLVKVLGGISQQVTQPHGVALANYEIADNAIVLPDDSGIDIEYVARIEDDACFPSLFREAMVAKIAAELSMRIKHSISFKQVFDTEFYNLIIQAELNNEIMRASEILPDSSWVNIRQVWSCF